MPIQLKEESGGKVLVIQANGNMVEADYDYFVPEFERLVRRNGKLRVLFDLKGFLGWKDGSLWDEIKFDIKHFSDIDRFAVVGDNKWKKAMATLCQPFTLATVRYFDEVDAPEARKWLGEA